MLKYGVHDTLKKKVPCDLEKMEKSDKNGGTHRVRFALRDLIEEVGEAGVVVGYPVFEAKRHVHRHAPAGNHGARVSYNISS